MTVEWTGTKNAASTGTGIGLDAVDITGGIKQAPPAGPALTRFEQTNTKIVYDGTVGHVQQRFSLRWELGLLQCGRLGCLRRVHGHPHRSHRLDCAHLRQGQGDNRRHSGVHGRLLHVRLPPQPQGPRASRAWPAAHILSPSSGPVRRTPRRPARESASTRRHRRHAQPSRASGLPGRHLRGDRPQDRMGGHVAVLGKRCTLGRCVGLLQHADVDRLVQLQWHSPRVLRLQGAYVRHRPPDDRRRVTRRGPLLHRLRAQRARHGRRARSPTASIRSLSTGPAPRMRPPPGPASASTRSRSKE